MTTLLQLSDPPGAVTLDSWAARDWSDGLMLPHLSAHDRLIVCTRNTIYEIIVTTPQTASVMIRGGAFFPDFTAARVCGSSLGGGFLKLHGIYPGFQLELATDDLPVITTRVRTVSVVRGTDTPVM